jgi:hypothetical protein
MNGAPYWFSALTLALGAVGGYFADWLHEARGAKREDTIAQRAFQRETLISLQDWLAKLGRSAGRIYGNYEIEFQRSRLWGRHEVDGELDNAFRDDAANIHRYRVRVLDDSIRERAHEFVIRAVEATHGATGEQNDAEAQEAALRVFYEMPDFFMALQEDIGKRLRELT